MDKVLNKPSGSKLPVFLRRSPEPADRPAARRALRRSKSVNDLKVFKTLKSHEVNPTKMLGKAPLRTVPQLAIFPQRGQPCNSIAEVALPSNLGRAKTTLQASSSKLALGKRAAESAKPISKTKVAKTTVNDQKENVKSVAPKQKIPPYDYKARFNALSERFEKFKVLHKDCMGTKTLCDSLQTENECMMEKLEKLEPAFECVSNELNTLKKEYNVLKKEHDCLKRDYTEVKQKHSSLSAEHAIMVQENETNLSRISQLESTVYLQSQKLQACDRDRRILHNLVQELKGNIRVFCRVRPALLSEQHRIMCEISYSSDKIEIKTPRTSNVNVKTNALVQEFMYDAVFPPEAMQCEIFDELDQLVQSALDGYHVCVFAYGQTGSGKTFTMQGDATQEGRGMIPRSVESLFQRISDLELAGWNYLIHASFLEIYNETVKDLLNPMSKLPHNIKYNEGKGVTITNLEIKTIHSRSELHKLIKEAEQNRSVAVTDYNEHSSRSHALTKIYLQGTHQSTKTVLNGSINLVDLAGSENAKRSTNETIAETKHINKSLAALSNVMLALHSKKNHVPYRDSKLTYLLESCLGGNSKTLMFVNVCPFEDCYTESVNALRFAAKVKEVKMNFKKNKSVA